MLQKLLIGEFEHLSDEQFENFDMDFTKWDVEGDHGHFFICKIKYPKVK